MHKGLRILIVEADPAEAQRLSRLVAEMGHRSHTAANLVAAQEVLGQTDFDLALASLPAPASDGPGFCRLLRDELAREDTAVALIGGPVSEHALAEMDLLDVLPRNPEPHLVRRTVRTLTENAAATAPFSLRDFERFGAHLEKASGLVFDAKRRHALELALKRRMRVIGVPTFDEYLARLVAGPNAEHEERRLVHLLTVGETSFFRNPAQFDVLRHEVLPALRYRRETGHRRVRLWSAACSTGEEAYSLAMVLLDVFPDAEQWDLRVTATDINRRSLAFARRGIYPDRSLRTVPAGQAERWFSQEPGGNVRVNDRVRSVVRFAELNLQTDVYPPANDVIFCRNVLIYFNRDGFRDTVGRMREALVPGGLLFLGHSENLLGLDVGLNTVHSQRTYFYKRPEADQEEPAEEPAPIVRKPAPTPVRFRLPGTALDRLERAAIRAPAPRAAPRPPEAPPLQKGLESVREFDRFLQHQPGSANELVGRGFLAANRGDTAAARRFAEQAIALDPLLAEAHFLLGVVAADAGESAKAVESFNRALFLQPELPMAHYHLAHLRAREQRVADARREFQNAIELLERGVEPHFTGGFPPEQLLAICRQGLAKLGGTTKR